MIYFGCVVKGRCEDYVENFKNKGEDFFLSDLAEQVHCNAQIAAKKISLVTTAMKLAFAGSLFWVVAVALLVIPK